MALDVLHGAIEALPAAELVAVHVVAAIESDLAVVRAAEVAGEDALTGPENAFVVLIQNALLESLLQFQNRRDSGIHLGAVVLLLDEMPRGPFVVVPRNDPIHRMSNKVYVDRVGQTELPEVEKVEMFDVRERFRTIFLQYLDVVFSRGLLRHKVIFSPPLILNVHAVGERIELVHLGQLVDQRPNHFAAHLGHAVENEPLLVVVGAAGVVQVGEAVVVDFALQTVVLLGGEGQNDADGAR